MADQGLSVLSTTLLTWAVVVYVLALVGFTAEAAFGSRAAQRVAAREARADRSAAKAARAASAAAVAPLAVASAPQWRQAAGGAGADSGSHTGAALLDRPEGTPAAAEASLASPSGSGRPVGSFADRLGRLAVWFTALGALLHAAGLVTRGLAAGRLPWGSMYEFAVAVTLSAVVVLLVLIRTRRATYLGLFVMLPVVLGLALALEVLYRAPGPLVPALNSAWLAIHVTAAIVTFGVFTASAAAAALYLLVTRYETRVAAGARIGFSGIARRLPDRAVLDRLSYRCIAFAFPIWTFAIVAGAIWAERAWGRYWGWDPKETWSFISWVGYAAYLHARTTVGWRGRRAAWVNVIAFTSMLVNYVLVNTVVSGLHSYSGL